jgi:hypothetical protein
VGPAGSQGIAELRRAEEVLPVGDRERRPSHHVGDGPAVHLWHWLLEELHPLVGQLGGEAQGGGNGVILVAVDHEGQRRWELRPELAQDGQIGSRVERCPHLRVADPPIQRGTEDAHVQVDRLVQELARRVDGDPVPRLADQLGDRLPGEFPVQVP